MKENKKIFDAHVGNKIRERRKALGLTQTELATIIGTSHQQVQRYESGENTISISTLLDIARLLNVKPTFFYENAPLTSSTEHKTPTGLITKDAKRPLRLLLVEDAASDELLFRKAVDKSNVRTDIQVMQDPRTVFMHLINNASQHDLIILDINMPYINGLELLKKIKGDSRLKTIPVIVLTNSVRSNDLLDAYVGNANGFIQKNSDLFEFYEEIDLMLQYWSRAVLLTNAA